MGLTALGSSLALAGDGFATSRPAFEIFKIVPGTPADAGRVPGASGLSQSFRIKVSQIMSSLPLPPLPPLPEWVRLHARAVDNGRTSAAFAGVREASRSRRRSRARSSLEHSDDPRRPVGSGATEHVRYCVSVSDDAEVTDDDGDGDARNSSPKPSAAVCVRGRGRRRGRSKPADLAKHFRRHSLPISQKKESGKVHSPSCGCTNTFSADQLAQSIVLPS